MNVVVIAASPSPISMCQNSIAGTVTAMPPTSENIGENLISRLHANAPKTTEIHEAVKTLM